MRDPFKDSGSADDWFNNLWTADVDMSTAMYGNTGTDMLYKSLIPKSPELTDIIDRADRRFGLGDTLKSLFALLYMKEPEKNNDGGILEQPVTDGVIKDEKYSQLKALCEDKKLPSFSAVCSFAESIEDVTDNAEVQKAAEIAGIISELKAHSENLAERINAEPKPDKRGILCSFLAAIVLAFGLGFVLVVLLGCPVLEGMLFAVTMGYGLMMVWDVVLLYRYFPQSEESPWAFLRWVDAFLPLAFTGLCTNIGLFAHLVICWAGPSGVQVKGLFYGAPYYDVPALIAFLTILVTSVNFVVSVEVNFYPKYRNYYSLFNDGGVVGDIVTAEEEMLAVLNRELRFTALKQLFVTAAVLSLENTLLALLPLGFNDLMHGYFRTLCVGYGLYAVGNTILMILLYFTDYGGAVAAAAVFAVSASGLTALSMALDPAFYGFGFLIGAALFYLVTLFRLDVFTANLPYRVLGQQPIVAETKAGRFTRLGLFLEHKKRKPTKSAKHSAS